MSGIDFFVDTNILIYIMTGHPHPEIPYIAKFAHGISAISEIELLGKKGITPHEAGIIRSLLNNCEIVNLNDAIKDIAISIRQKYAVKIPDAIIAATAKSFNLPLVTADRDFGKIDIVDIVLLDLTN